MICRPAVGSVTFSGTASPTFGTPSAEAASPVLGEKGDAASGACAPQPMSRQGTSASHPKWFFMGSLPQQASIDEPPKRGRWPRDYSRVAGYFVKNAVCNSNYGPATSTWSAHVNVRAVPLKLLYALHRDP